MAKVYNWGMYPKVDAYVVSPHSKEVLVKQMDDFDSLIARGNGRCYGDSSLHSSIVSTLNLREILNVDTVNQTITAEAGVLFDDILRKIVPMGYFLPVVPGTKFITLGGAIAANIHGKNHHIDGDLAGYVEHMQIITDEGSFVECSPNKNPELFFETIGGMGLTGIMVSATLKLKKIETAYIQSRSVKAKNIDKLFELLENNRLSTYSVAWVDCFARGKNLGRSLLLIGEHAQKVDIAKRNLKNTLKVHNIKQLKLPYAFLSLFLNTLTMRIFNTLYFFKQWKKNIKFLSHYDSFFFPLDKLKGWNKMYGKNGFTQYQFVIPFENGKEGVKEILRMVSSSKRGAYLAVLKSFGEPNTPRSQLSFPMAGYTLAMDFPVNQVSLELMNKLDELVMKYGGRLYLAKDARMSSETFKQMYPKASLTSSKFSSLQSKRLFHGK